MLSLFYNFVKFFMKKRLTNASHFVSIKKEYFCEVKIMDADGSKGTLSLYCNIVLCLVF